MVLHLIRAIFLLVVLAFTLTFSTNDEIFQEGAGYITAYILIPFIVALLLVIGDMIWQNKKLHLISGLFFGLLAGLVIAYVLSLVVDLAVNLYPAPPAVSKPVEPVEPLKPENTEGEVGEAERTAYKRAETEYRQKLSAFPEKQEAYREYMRFRVTVQFVKLLIGAASVYICVSIVMQTKDELRFIIPYVEFSKQSKGAQPVLLDTSVIIDGRIADIVETRIFQSELVVPRFVLNELQAIADSGDKLKRNRGRRGLDVLGNLQANEKLDINILDIHSPDLQRAETVDAKLVALAEHLHGKILTNDYNLNKIAQLRGIDVININDLANALKPIVLPGETMQVKILRAGEEPGQGVGYLDDGTMVVADQGRDHISEEVSLVVTSVLQTSAGRMIFGRVEGEDSSPRGRKNT